MQSEVITQQPNRVPGRMTSGSLKRWSYILVPLAILFALILWRLRAKQQDAAQQDQSRAARKNAPVAVSAVPVQVRDIVQTFSAVGNVESPFNVKIASKVTGRIDLLQLREGDKVQVGQVLARIDPTQIEAQVRQQQSAVAEAQFRLAQAQLGQGPNNVNINTQISQQAAGLASAQADYNQTRGNYAAQVASAQAAVVDAQGRIKNADAGIASAQADYAQVRGNYMAQVAVAQAAVQDAQGRVKNAQAGLTSAQADYNQTRQNYAAQVAAAQAAVTDAQGRVRSAVAAISNANATIKSAQANLANARTQYNRTYSLYKQGFVAAQDVDNAKTEVSVQQGSLDVARGQLDVATASRESATAQQQAAQNQADIVITKGKADIEAAQAKVGQAQAVVESAVAQRKAAEQQANIAQTTGKSNINAARAKVVQAQAVRSSSVAQKNSAQHQASIVATKGQSDIEAARQKAVQASAALTYARSNTASKSAYEQSLSALRASVEAAQASLRGVQSQLADTILRSPINGYVTARYLDPGAVATAGQPIVAVQAVRQVWVTVPVPEDVSRKIHFGQTAVVTLDALPGQTFMSKIVEINPSADPQSRQFTVRAVLDNPRNFLKPGMFAHVSLEAERNKSALVVPREAVQQDNSGNYVMVITADDKVQRRVVTTGASDANGVAITQGVQPGEKVATLSAMPLRDGQAVRVGAGKGKGGRGGGQRGAGGAQAGGGQGGNNSNSAGNGNADNVAGASNGGGMSGGAGGAGGGAGGAGGGASGGNDNSGNGGPPGRQPATVAAPAGAAAGGGQ